MLFNFVDRYLPLVMVTALIAPVLVAAGLGAPPVFWATIDMIANIVFIGAGAFLGLIGSLTIGVKLWDALTGQEA